MSGRKVMKKYLAIVSCVGLALTAFAGKKNLIKNGDFEHGSDWWKGDANIVFETQDKTNRICKINVSPDKKYKFYQHISTSKMDRLKIRFRVKKSSDYKGNGYWIECNTDKGGSGYGQYPPRNNKWNVVEVRMGDVVEGAYHVDITIAVKKAESGSLSFDDIEVFEDDALDH